MKNYGIQLYSVRDAMQKDMESALADIASLGYGMVEFAGFFGRSAESVKETLEKNGLAIIGTHSSFDDLRPTKILETIAYHKAIGNKNYVIPGADLSTLEKIEDFVSVVNYAKPILAAEGIRLGYHNHSHEFVVMPWGSTIHAELERRTELDFELDVYWLYNAGLNPVTVMEKLKSRLTLVHLKDGLPGGKGATLGKGEVPIVDVIAYAEKLGIPMIVESETLTPDGPTEAKECIAYLRSLEN